MKVGELQMNCPIGIMLKKANLINFFEIYKFILIGICSVLIDFIFYFLFIYFHIFDPNISKKISFILGAIFAFYANRDYVFRVIKKNYFQYFGFATLYFISFMANSYVHDVVLIKSKVLMIAFLIATIVSTIINYIGQKFLIFRK